MDVICVRETSQKYEQDLKYNVKLDNYNPPFTTGSKFNKGGVAIYIKNTYDAIIRRDDLQKVDDASEGIWVEIINKK